MPNRKTPNCHFQATRSRPGQMALRIIMLWLLLCTISESNTLLASDKHRLIVLTDIENEPDDAMSLVRFLCYSNQWDVEGLVASPR
jgi:hypothetical protein